MWFALTQKSLLLWPLHNNSTVLCIWLNDPSHSFTKQSVLFHITKWFITSYHHTEKQNSLLAQWTNQMRWNLILMIQVHHLQLSFHVLQRLGKKGNRRNVQWPNTPFHGVMNCCRHQSRLFSMSKRISGFTTNWNRSIKNIPAAFAKRKKFGHTVNATLQCGPVVHVMCDIV